MAGRKPIFDREEQRKNQVVVPLSEQEKNQIKEAAKETMPYCDHVSSPLP